MPSRTCPVCRTNKIWRREVRTCGHSCAQIWIHWSSAQKAKAIENADTPLVPFEELDLNPTDTEEPDDSIPDFLKE